MNNKWHYLYLFILAVLAVGIGIFFSKNSHTEDIYHSTTDTVFDTIYDIKFDTIPVVETYPVYSKVIDTLYITSEDSEDTTAILPIEQKHYAKDSVYDIWVSGIMANLDSANIYQKTEYVTTTIEITKEIYPKRTEWYIFGGLSVFDGILSPKVGVSLKTKKDWLISPEIGWYKDNPTYGITIGKKIK